MGQLYSTFPPLPSVCRVKGRAREDKRGRETAARDGERARETGRIKGMDQGSQAAKITSCLGLSGPLYTHL